MRKDRPEDDLGAFGERLLRGLRGAARGEASCPACQAQLAAEARYVEALLALLEADAEVRSTLEASGGLCRRHTLAAVRSGRPGGALVAERTRRAIAALVADLDEVIRKEDYRFRHEARSEAERSAPARAVAWAAGSDGLV